MKGKCRVPSAIKYAEMDGSALAGVVGRKGSSEYGNLLINKKAFGNIDESINEYLKSNDKISPSLYDTMSRFKGFFKEESFGDLEKMVESFRQSPGAISFEDKVKLFNELRTVQDFVERLGDGYLFRIFENLNANKYSIEFYKDNGRVVCKLSDSIQSCGYFDALGDADFIFEEIGAALSDALIKNQIPVEHGNTKVQSSFSSIYHEFGHLQDIERVLTRAPATSQLKKGAKMPAALKEWLDNSEAQKVAREVSWYSTQGPSEFIAEVFAGLMNGNKFSDDVMALYRKLHGPSIPNIV